MRCAMLIWFGFIRLVSGFETATEWFKTRLSTRGSSGADETTMISVFGFI